MPDEIIAPPPYGHGAPAATAPVPRGRQAVDPDAEDLGTIPPDPTVREQATALQLVAQDALNRTQNAIAETLRLALAVADEGERQARERARMAAAISLLAAVEAVEAGVPGAPAAMRADAAAFRALITEGD